MATHVFGRSSEHAIAYLDYKILETLVIESSWIIEFLLQKMIDFFS